MSIIDSGRYRLRKDWASASIPSLVDIDEQADDDVKVKTKAKSNTLSVSHPLPPQKPPRRSSLALSLFSSKSDKSQKRRSSIAVTFLRRDNNKNNNKDSYESAVKHEKSDGSIITPEITIYSSDENIRASSPTEPSKLTYFDDGTCLRPVIRGMPLPHDASNDAERNRRRRSSLQVKLDRRRRKNLEVHMTNSQNSLSGDSQSDLASAGNGGMEAAGSNTSTGDISPTDIDSDYAAYYPRQKRNSWWNIFVPDNLKSRSKSRSVDHGLAAPFDLDSLRSKVEGRFESVDRLSNERKKSSLPSIPTIAYTVGNRDTLTSVAARFDTTPSELTHINRLTSSFIYPGQQLLVPDKSAKDESFAGQTADDKVSSTSGRSTPADGKTAEEINNEKDILEGLRPGSPKPGHIERISDAEKINDVNKTDDPVITQRFLKINVRHITDGQGVVGGVLLVTPNAIMFDPNVSDALVIEHSADRYGVIAPMELVVNAAIFNDIAHMRVSGGVDLHEQEKAEIYFPKAVLEARQAQEECADNDAELAKAEKSNAEADAECVEACEEVESVCSSTARIDDLEKVEEAKESVKTDEDHVIVTATGPTDEAEDKKTLNITDTRTTLEERRKSLLDHHWAIPSKDRSSEDEGDNESNTTADSGIRIQDAHSATSSLTGGIGNLASGIAAIDLERLEQLSKQPCYDSGIDGCEPIPNIQPIAKKTVYSDADIVLSSDWVPPKTISPTHVSESPPRSSISGNSLDASSGLAGGRKKTSSVSFSIEDSGAEQQQPPANAAQSEKNVADKKNKMLKRLSYPLTWMEGLTGDATTVVGAGPSTSSGAGNSIGKSLDTDSAPNTGDSNQSVFSKVFSRRSSIGTFMRPHSSEGTASTTKLKDLKQQPKLDYRSMVSVDDKPELFQSVDKLIPRPARACPDPPLYLRLRMGKPIGKAIPLPTSVMSYGKNKLRPEYWFSVPKNRADELYRFMNTWVPHLYGELDEAQIQLRGFELIQHDTEWVKGGTSKTGQRDGSQDSEEISDLTRESWEVLHLTQDEFRKASAFAASSFDLDFPLPDLIGTTEILTEDHREKLCTSLPARAEGYSWTLVFSTSQHGFSLNSLYRKMQKLESPVLIVIEDTEHNVFGALTSCSLHVSDHFYGTGESLLFKFNPTFKVFHWTGENLYFIKGNMESLSIGAGNGRFGLWLDGDLNQGRSQSCSTYGNEPLAPQEDFVIKTLECWAFV